MDTGVMIPSVEEEVEVLARARRRKFAVEDELRILCARRQIRNGFTDSALPFLRGKY